MKTKNAFIVSMLLVATNMFSQQISLRNFPTDKVMVVAHRGDWRNYPENSIKAVQSCIKMGVDIVEIDVQCTKDNELIVMHDKTIDRTTTGKGIISELSLDSIKNTYLRNGSNAKTLQKVPTLKEMMLFVKGKPILVNIDKAWEHLDMVYELLKETGTVNQVIVKGNDPVSELKKKYGSMIDSLIYMPMVWPENYSIYQREKVLSPLEYTEHFISDYKPLAFEVIINEEQSSVLEAVNLMRKEGVLVWINTLWPELCAGHIDELAVDDPEKHWGWVLSIGANIIQTDNPVELIDYLKKKGIKH